MVAQCVQRKRTIAREELPPTSSRRTARPVEVAIRIVEPADRNRQQTEILLHLRCQADQHRADGSTALSS